MPYVPHPDVPLQLPSCQSKASVGWKGSEWYSQDVPGVLASAGVHTQALIFV